MKKQNIFQRVFILSAIVLGFTFAAYLSAGTSPLVLAAVSDPVTPTPVSAPVTPTPTPIDLVVDNTSTGFSTTGRWTISTTGSGFVGSNYLVGGKQQSGKTAKWAPVLPAGNYKVSVRYGSGSWATKVQYIVASANGLQTFYVNQSINSGQWIELGTFQFNTTLPYYVQVKDNPKGTVVADAARFEQVL